MLLENALKSVGYMDTVLFLTISKSDIYHHNCLGSRIQIFIIDIGADLPKLSGIDI